MSRKGFIGDAFAIIAILFTMAICFVVAMAFFSGLDAGLNVSQYPIAQGIVTSTNSNIDWTLDFLFIMALLSFPVGSMILAYVNNIPPFFFFASFGVVLLVVVFGAAFSQGWKDASEDGIFGLQADRMPMMDFVMTHFAVYALFCVVMIAAGTYVKLKNSAIY